MRVIIQLYNLIQMLEIAMLALTDLIMRFNSQIMKINIEVNKKGYQSLT